MVIMLEYCPATQSSKGGDHALLQYVTVHAACAAYGMSTDRLTPYPFNLCRKVGSTHTSISQTQPLDMMLSRCTQLLWSTMARPALSGTCPVKTAVWSWPPCCSSVSGSWQSSYSLRHLYVERQLFFSDPQRVLCHEVPC